MTLNFPCFAFSQNGKNTELDSTINFNYLDSTTEQINYKTIDSFFEQEMTRMRVPGAILVIIKNHEVKHVRDFGVTNSNYTQHASEASNSLGSLITANTPFILGSTSKSFTAISIMQLVDQGLIELDKPVQKYLPWFKVADATSSSKITIRQLLNHTSGISEIEGRLRLADKDTSDSALERHVRELRSTTLVHQPGTAFQYSNSNYSTLGLIIQEVSGLSYESYIENNIFKPLAMNNSFTSQQIATKNGLAIGHRYWFGYPKPEPDLPFVRGALPAGYLIASANDMSRYLLAHLNAGYDNELQIVSKNGFNELYKPVSKLSPDWSYAMGWVAGTVNGRNILWHNGAVANYYSYVAIFPDRGDGCIILMNAFDMLSANEFDAVSQGILDLFTGMEVAKKPALMKKLNSQAYGLTITILVIQLGWILISFQFRKKWLSSSSGRSIFNRFVMPPGMAIIWSLLMLIWFPSKFNVNFHVMQLYAPAPGLFIAISVLIAIVWSIKDLHLI